MKLIWTLPAVRALALEMINVQLVMVHNQLLAIIGTSEEGIKVGLKKANSGFTSV